MRKLFVQVDQLYNKAIEQKRLIQSESKNVNGSGRKDLLPRLLELKHFKDVSSPSSSITMPQLKALLQVQRTMVYFLIYPSVVTCLACNELCCL